jgi:hypothetical protein
MVIRPKIAVLRERRCRYVTRTIRWCVPGPHTLHAGSFHDSRNKTRPSSRLHRALTEEMDTNTSEECRDFVSCPSVRYTRGHSAFVEEEQRIMTVSMLP